MNKRVLAPVMAIAIAAGSVVAVGNADAKEMTDAELYEPRIGAKYDLGPDPDLSFLVFDSGPRVASIDIDRFESPYPGLKMERAGYSNFPHAVYLKLEGGKIYPESFDVLVGVTVRYDDGSFEYVEGPFTITPLKSLVASEPAKPVVTAAPRPTVTTTVTTTATQTVKPTPRERTVTVTTTANVRETITQTEALPAHEATTTTATVTATPVPQRPTVTSTTTVSRQNTVTETETATVTETVAEKAEQQVPSEGSSVGTGGIITIVLGVLAILGAGALAFSGGIPPQVAGALPL